MKIINPWYNPTYSSSREFYEVTGKPVAEYRGVEIYSMYLRSKGFNAREYGEKSC